MTLRNANKRARNRKHLESLLGMRLQDYIAIELRRRYEGALRDYYNPVRGTFQRSKDPEFFQFLESISGPILSDTLEIRNL